MNEFDTKLRAAQLRQRKRLSLGAGILLVTAVLMAALFAYLNGTSLKITPEDAEQTAVVQVSGGLGLAVSNVVYSLSSETQINVSAAGFKPETIQLTADDKGRTVDVVLQELPARLSAVIDPADEKLHETARWTLNGERVAIAPSFDQELAAGSYTLEVDSAYFEVESRAVTLERGGEAHLQIKLKPLSGQVSIRSLPAGATVKIDGRDVGMTPLVQTIAGGMHQIEIALSGYQSISDTFEIDRTNADVVRNYRLLRQSSELSFDLNPADGVLLVNGIKTDGDRVLSLASGVETAISYSRDGYFAHSRTIILKPGGKQLVRLELQPEYGEVEVISTPSADVYINDKLVGTSPLTIDLVAIPHKVSIQKPGFRSVTKTFIPTTTGTITIREQLKTETGARLAEAPGFYTNSLGMELLMFKPSAFEMGAPRHQKGQRANEFQRKVNLVKPFYAAKHETTNQQFTRFKKDHGVTGGARAPVTSLRWIEAVRFSNWLSKKENLVPFYAISGNRVTAIHAKANGYRLLSEPEWEWLARRANRTSQTVFPWGDTPTVPKMAGNIADEAARGGVAFYIPNYNDGFSGKAPVGSFKAEASGLYDLAGNVSEWVNDAYSLQLPATNVVEVDPIGPVIGNTHVVKGANWRSGTRTTLRAAYREGLVERRDDVGFRIGRYL